MFNASDFWEPKPDSEVLIPLENEWIPAWFLWKENGTYVVEIDVPDYGTIILSVDKVRSKHELF